MSGDMRPVRIQLYIKKSPLEINSYFETEDMQRFIDNYKLAFREKGYIGLIMYDRETGVVYYNDL